MCDLLKTYYLLLLHFSLYSELMQAVLASALRLSGVSSVCDGPDWITAVVFLAVKTEDCIYEWHLFIWMSQKLFNHLAATKYRMLWIQKTNFITNNM